MVVPLAATRADLLTLSSSVSPEFNVTGHDRPISLTVLLFWIPIQCNVSCQVPVHRRPNDVKSKGEGCFRRDYSAADIKTVQNYSYLQ